MEDLPLMCAVLHCRRNGTEALVRHRVVVAMVCAEHEQQIEADNWWGWKVRSERDGAQHICLFREREAGAA